MSMSTKKMTAICETLPGGEVMVEIYQIAELSLLPKAAQK